MPVSATLETLGTCAMLRVHVGAASAAFPVVLDPESADGTSFTPRSLLVRLQTGVACTSDVQCASDACTDGVCCDKRCLGACETCASATKGVCSPADGPPASGHATCAPYNVCRAGACATDCGSDADCAEGSQCYPETKTCGVAKPRCDGEHTVTPLNGAPRDCSPYRCAPAGDCQTECATTSDCIDNHVCSNGVCVSPVQASEPTSVGMRRPTVAVNDFSRHKLAAAVLTIAALTSSTPAAAATDVDTVELVDGGRVRGTIMTQDPKLGARVRRADGTVVEIAADRIAKVTYGDAAVASVPHSTHEPAIAPADRPFSPTALSAGTYRARREEREDQQPARHLSNRRGVGLDARAVPLRRDDHMVPRATVILGACRFSEPLRATGERFSAQYSMASNGFAQLWGSPSGGTSKQPDNVANDWSQDPARVAW